MGWALAGLLCLGGRASAQETKPGNVLIVRVAGDESIVVRVRAELSSYRFRVVEQQAAARRSKELSELAEERDAQAALRAKPDAMAVELWVRAGGRTSEELVSAGPGRNPEVLALRVTEAMRARGLALPPLVAAAAPKGAARPGWGDAADSSKPSPAADSGKRPAANSPDSDDDPGVAEPTPPPPAATPIAAPKLGEPESETARASTEAQKPKPTERKPDDAAERKAAEAAERKAAEAAERKAAEAAERKAAEAAERKAAEAAERKAAEAAERKAAEAAERKAAEADRKAAEAAERNDEPDTEPASEADEASTEQAASEPQDTTPFKVREALVYAEVGPSGVWSPGNNRVGPTLDALISLRFRPYQTSSISLVGMIPLLRTDLQTPDGAEVEVNTYAIGGFGDLHLPLGRVELSAGLGALALLSSVTVTSTDLAYISSYKTQRLAALLGRAGASYAITRDLRVSGSVMAGLTVNELQVAFPRAPGDGETSMTKADVTWGRPLLIGSLTLELALPSNR